MRQMTHIRPKGHWDSSSRGYSTEVLMICNCTSCTNEWLVGEGRNIVADALIKKLQREEHRISIERALQSEYFDGIEEVESWRREQ